MLLYGTTLTCLNVLVLNAPSERGRELGAPESARGRRFWEGTWGLQNRKHRALITHTHTQTGHLPTKSVWACCVGHLETG